MDRNVQSAIALSLVAALAIGGCGGSTATHPPSNKTGQLVLALLTARDLGSGFVATPTPATAPRGTACGTPLPGTFPLGLETRAFDKRGPEGFTLVLVSAKQYASIAAARKKFESDLAHARSCRSNTDNGVTWKISTIRRPHVGDASFATIDTSVTGPRLTVERTTMLVGDVLASVGIGVGPSQADNPQVDDRVAALQATKLRSAGG